MNEKKTYGYARVSTKDQNVDRQIQALIEAGVPKKNIYLDKISGIHFDRPQYKRLLKRLDVNSVLYIKSIDRLGRSYRELCHQWEIITKIRGADVVVLDMPILDTRKEKNLMGTLISDLVLTLLSYIAENEYLAIHQRQAEGILAAKARGIKFGRPPKPLPNNFNDVYIQWESGVLSTRDAAMQLNMPPTTFRYKAKQYKLSKI